MKMFYGRTPIQSTKVHHFDVNSNDATMVASDLQSGVSAYAKGKKIIGTGKAFEFAMYGTWMTNLPTPIPTTINVIQIGSVDYPIKTIVPIHNTTMLDFTNSQTIAEVVIDGTPYSLIVSVQNGMLAIYCEHTIEIQLFYGKDRYI